MSKTYAFFEAGMRESLQSYAFPHALQNLLITYTESRDIPILGAAALCFDGEK